MSLNRRKFELRSFIFLKISFLDLVTRLGSINHSVEYRLPKSIGTTYVYVHSEYGK